MLVWQCPSPQSHTREPGVYRDDAFKDGFVGRPLLQVCSFKAKNNNLATPRFPPAAASKERAVVAFDLRSPLRWMRRPAGVMAAGWFMDRVNEAGSW